MDNPIQDDERLEDVNTQQFVDQVVRDAQSYVAMSQGRHVMFMMGCDYEYDNAEMWYSNLDRLIQAVNADGRVAGRYSSPDEYTSAKHIENLTWTVKTTDQDFMPICQGPSGSDPPGHMYWAGYFTSRPALKYNVRSSGQFLQAARQLQYLAKLPVRQFVHEFGSTQAQAEGAPYRHWSAAAATDLAPLQAAVGLMTHHDAVTGTERQHVANDYAKHLAAGRQVATQVVAAALAILAGGGGENFTLCEQLNATVCSATATLAEKGKSLQAIVYNPSSSTRSEWVRMPLQGDQAHGGQTLTVTNVRTKQAVPAVVEAAPAFGGATQAAAFREQIPANTSDAVTQLVWLAQDLPAMGAELFIVTNPSQADENSSSSYTSEAKTSDDSGDSGAITSTTLENAHLRVDFGRTTGLMTQITNKDHGITTKINQTWRFYFAQRSGPWMLALHHPDEPLSEQPDRTGRNASCAGGFACAASLTIQRTSSGQKATQVFGGVDSWVTQAVFLGSNSSVLEIEYTIGPVPATDNRSREIFSRFSTDIASGDRFLSDSNGYETVEQRRNYRKNFKLRGAEPIASNVVPINSMLAIADATRTLTVMNDRSQGGTSLVAGEIDLFVHRRLQGCDYCSSTVHDQQSSSEALNETTGFTWSGDDWATTHNYRRTGAGLVVRGKHFLAFTAPPAAGATYRNQQEKISNPLVIGLRSVPTAQDVHRDSLSRIVVGQPGVATPYGVAVLSLELRRPGSLLIRVMNQFGVGEGGPSEVNVTLAGILPHTTITDVEELGLTANGPVPGRRNLRRWRSDGKGTESLQNVATVPNVEADSIITLRALQIRTFVLSV